MITTSHAFAPSVNARVAGSGIHRRILYTVKPVPGQQVEFIERSNQVLRQLGAARGRTGSIPFTATPGPQRRQILANVYEQGTPGPALTVASYQPPQRVRWRQFVASAFTAPARRGPQLGDSAARDHL